ncbi:MAG: hypothetical protein FJZ79_07385 [Chlorobi bacterium]|nr:hypothetical protein [Chlorobiota bacterium]
MKRFRDTGEYEPYFSKIKGEMDRANLLRNFLFSDCTKALFINALSRTRTMPYHFMDLMSGAIAYKDLFAIIQQKAVKLVFG